MKNNQTTYPSFYRNAGTCMRVDSATEAWSITLPPDEKVPCRKHSVYPSPGRLQEDLKGFRPSSADEFKSFVATFYQEVSKERERVLNQNGFFNESKNV